MCKIQFCCCLITTLSTWIAFTFVNGFNLFCKIWFSCCLIITLITWIAFTLMNWLYKLCKMRFMCSLLLYCQHVWYLLSSWTANIEILFCVVFNAVSFVAKIVLASISLWSSVETFSLFFFSPTWSKFVSRVNVVSVSIFLEIGRTSIRWF